MGGWGGGGKTKTKTNKWTGSFRQTFSPMVANDNILQLTFDLALARLFKETKFRFSQEVSQANTLYYVRWIPTKTAAISHSYFCGTLNPRHMYGTAGIHQRLNNSTKVPLCARYSQLRRVLSFKWLVRTCKCYISSYNNALRKSAYSNILKILPPKTENYLIKNSDIFHISD